MLSRPTNQIPEEIIQRLRLAERVTVLTGAGISAESGMPTFRQAQTGLWARYRPEDLATPQAFRHDPRLVWEWYEWRRGLAREAKPNPGHRALAELERRYPAFTLITQNVDGLHQQAGSGEHGALIELHGNIHRTKCFDEERLVDRWEPTGEVPPRCPYCGGLLRPDVVWFGEHLPEEGLFAAWEAAQNCQVFLSIGTSGIVEPAASLPYLAMQSGATVVEINPNTTPLTGQAAYTLNGSARVLLPELVRALEQH
jgi:NAD-dependent deacetylase